jgi:hypothetical protein
LEPIGLGADSTDVLNRQATIAISIAMGVVLELGVHALSGRQEAWDSAQYWTVGIPAVLLLSLVVGALSQRGSWRWTALVVPAQVLTMMLRSGELGGLWPVAVVLSTVLSLPFVLAAFVGSRFRTGTAS